MLRRSRVQAHDAAAFDTAVRYMRSRQWAHIVARAAAQLVGVAETLQALSDLADAVLDACTRYHLRRARSSGGPFTAVGGGWAGLCVLAQGKLGGQELNVSSDIDLQFLYDRPSEADVSTCTLQARYTAVARQIVHSLGHSDAAGLGYRVDIDLRPEGKKGPLINTIAAAETYYATWGQPWEALALIRARPVAGARWVGQAFLRHVHGFIYPRHVAEETLHKVRSVAGRIARERQHARLQAGLAPGIDIKRDRGGIRDVELFVQTLQHLHGGRQPSLQTGSQRVALAALQLCGLLPQTTCEQLYTGYLTLREVENWLQADEERQTHTLPEDAAGLAFLARQMRLRGGPRALRRRLSQARHAIRRRTQPLFAAPSERGRSPAAVALATSGAAQCAALEALGFAQPREAQGALQVVAQGQGGPFCGAEASGARRLARALLRAMGHSPDPDQALRLYADLDPLLRRAPGYLQLLAAAPTVRRRLIDLLGTSEFLGRTLVRFPELLDWLAATQAHAVLRLPTDAAAYTHKALGRLQRFAGDLDLQGRALCRFKLREQLRIGVLDIASALPVAHVTRQLAGLAQACIEVALRLAAASVAGPQATAELAAGGLGFAVLALGRLGGSDMGYGSDLDLVFVYSPELTEDPSDASSYALRLAQRCIGWLTARQPEGTLYPIDTRLRPSGNQGPLVSSETAFVAYYHERAMLWERQALLRARPVAGDITLGARVLGRLQAWRYPTALPAEAWTQIHVMRQRMQAQRSHTRGTSGRAPDRTDIKMDAGGLVDLEFAVQALQLRHAHANARLRQTHTAAALEALAEAGHISRQRAPSLLAAYWFLRRLENALRVVHDQPLSAIDFAHPGAQALARRMGYGGRAHPARALQHDWQQMARRAHRLYCDVLQPTGRP
jgi:glutamate-ammonia-ligase adenylyltransferase